MKKDIIIGALLLIIGVAIGFLCRPKRIERVVDTQRDTINNIRYYSRLELKENTYKLDVPKIGVAEYVFVASDSVSIVYKDSIQYIMLPRQRYFTSVDDVNIWHSGVDSTIDSLNVVHKTEIITKTTHIPMPKNRIALGVEATYINTLSIPIYLEYGRMLHENVEIYGRILRDVKLDQTGVAIGTRIQFGW